MEGSLDFDHGSGSGELCLDWANTADWHASGNPKETIPTYLEFVKWCERRAVLTPAEAGALLDSVESDKDSGASTMEEARRLREAIYGLFSKISHGKTVRDEDLQTLNSFLSKGMSAASLALEEGRFRWGWSFDEQAPDMMLWPIAKSAAELLTSEKLQRVKECANEEEGCGWLFLDTSRSGNRVWCSMDSCGNRAKFRAYYARHRSKAKPKATRGAKAS